MKLHIGGESAKAGWKILNIQAKANVDYIGDISVPDMDKLCTLYLDKILNFEQRWHVMRMIFGGQVDSFDFHYAGWNEEPLSAYLTRTGFSQIKKVDFFGLFEDTSNFSPYGSPISLNITATK